MNEKLAVKWLTRFKNSRFGSYTVEDLLGAGKSAAVFKAQCPTRGPVALKIFDPDVVQRFSTEPQPQRLERELSLRNHDCSTLITILDGGTQQFDGEDYFFITMELVRGMTIDKAIKAQGVFPEPSIRRILKDLWQAVSFLSARSLCHRDIKPPNIMLLDYSSPAAFDRAVLLDLGVLRPVGESDVTDHSGHLEFVGTLQYSPPEFLFRKEENTSDGWLAISIYQVGAVLHDLLVGRPLFDDFKEPFANLVRAVNEEMPVIVNENVGRDLIMLAKDLLLKDPEQRLKSVTRERVERVLKTDRADAEKVDPLARVKDRIEEAKRWQMERDADKEKQKQREEEQYDHIQVIVQTCLVSMQDLDADLGFDNVTVLGRGPILEPMYPKKQRTLPRPGPTMVFEWAANLGKARPRSLFILIDVPVHECQVPIAIVKMGAYAPGATQRTPLQFIERAYVMTKRYKPYIETVYRGTFSKNDLAAAIHEYVTRIFTRFFDVTAQEDNVLRQLQGGGRLNGVSEADLRNVLHVEKDRSYVLMSNDAIEAPKIEP